MDKRGMTETKYHYLAVSDIKQASIEGSVL